MVDVHLPQIEFISDQKHRNVERIFRSENIAMQLQAFVQRATIDQREDQEKAFADANVLFAHRPKFFLSGGIENLQMRDFAVDEQLFHVRVFDRRIVVREEERFDELNGDGRLKKRAEIALATSEARVPCPRRHCPRR